VRDAPSSRSRWRLVLHAVAALLVFALACSCTYYPATAGAVARGVERDPYGQTLRTDWIQAQPGYLGREESFRLELHQGPSGQRETVITYRHHGLRVLGLWRVRVDGGAELAAQKPVVRELGDFGRTFDGPRRYLDEMVSARLPEDLVARMQREEVRVLFEGGENVREVVVRPYVMQGFLQACEGMGAGAGGGS
jgi:hypothetical protein